jgi:hypothetical protein
MAMLAGLSAAWAQVGDPSGGPVPAPAPAPAPGQAATPVPVQPATPQATPGTPGAAVEPWDLDPAAQPGRAGSVMRRPEPLLQKPSGFWTSGRPAVGGAYRYRLLAIGTGVLLVTAAVMVWIVRRYPRRDPETRWNG